MSKLKYTAKEKYLIKQNEKSRADLNNLLIESNLLKKEIESLKLLNKQITDDNEQLKDWTDRLCQYTKISEDEIKTIVQDAKKSLELNETLKSFASVFSCFNKFY